MIKFHVTPKEEVAANAHKGNNAAAVLSCSFSFQRNNTFHGQPSPSLQQRKNNHAIDSIIMSDHQTIPDSNMSDRHNNLPPTSKTENITAMSDRVSPTAQQAAVPTENPPSPQHANGHGHHHEHHHHTAQYGGNINPHETAEHVMAVFDRQMMALSEENTLASHTQACEIAEMLLERAELPLAFRVHAHIVLGCGKNGYLHHANEAVRFAEMGQRIYGPGKTPEAQAAVEDLMWQARETLRRAERDMEELEGIKESVKAGHLKLKSGQKLVYGNLNGEFSKVFLYSLPVCRTLSRACCRIAQCF